MQKWTWTGARFTKQKPRKKQLAAPNLALLLIRARFYDPNLGEFVSRDPLGFVDGMSLYRAYFAPGNMDPTGMDVDISGKNGDNCLGICGAKLGPDAASTDLLKCLMNCTKENSDCCSEAKRLGLVPKNHVGGVVFCRGRIVSCVWISGGSTGATDPTAVKIVDHCTYVHEDAHHEDQDWGQCGNAGSPTPKRPTVPQPTWTISECKAYTAQLSCLEQSKVRCPTEACHDQVQKAIDFVRKQKDKYCLWVRQNVPKKEWPEILQPKK